MEFSYRPRLCRFGLVSPLFAAALISCSHGHKGHHKHSFEDVERYAARFESAERDKWQKPDEVIKRLQLKPGMQMANIGAGTGYFSRRMARAAGEGGQVLALDIEEKMVEYMKADAAKTRLKAYRPRLVAPDDPGLEAGSVELVLTVNTYHHIADRPDYFKKVAAALKKAGRLVIIDFKKVETPTGPPMKYRLSPEEVAAELKEAGFSLQKNEDFLPYQYMLTFTVGR